MNNPKNSSQLGVLKPPSSLLDQWLRPSVAGGLLLWLFVLWVRSNNSSSKQEEPDGITTYYHNINQPQFFCSQLSFELEVGYNIYIYDTLPWRKARSKLQSGIIMPNAYQKCALGCDQTPAPSAKHKRCSGWKSLPDWLTLHKTGLTRLVRVVDSMLGIICRLSNSACFIG